MAEAHAIAAEENAQADYVKKSLISNMSRTKTPWQRTICGQLTPANASEGARKTKPVQLSGPPAGLAQSARVLGTYSIQYAVGQVHVDSLRGDDQNRKSGAPFQDP